MNYKESLEAALEIQLFYMPYSYRVKIAGSIRRKDPIIKDIDIVVILKPGYFELINKYLTLAEKLVEIKGKTQSIDNRRVRAWFAKTENWGFLLAKATGHPDYSPKELEEIWVSQGYEEKDGCLYKGDNLMFVPSEEKLYELLGLSYEAPLFDGPDYSFYNDDWD